jgi:hypothetical protein
MKTMLVGNTGFIGSNLCGQHTFDCMFHSSDIEHAYGLKPDLLVYAGVRAEMFLANQEPHKDLQLVCEAMENIRKIQPKQVVLISTVAVYKNTSDQAENSVLPILGLPFYGLHRYFLECWVQDNYRDHLIVRLPALFGKNLKKNFLYDYIHYIPYRLKKEKYMELAQQSIAIRQAYLPGEHDFYIYTPKDPWHQKQLKAEFKRLNFSALNFTDSRSVYQFYCLDHLWQHILFCLNTGIKKINLVTEPIRVSELYKYLAGEIFCNELAAQPYNYDLKTIHSNALNGENGYIFNKQFILEEIKEFVNAYHD